MCYEAASLLDISADYGDSSSDNENADIGWVEIGSKEEPSEEEEIEENPSEEEEVEEETSEGEEVEEDLDEDEAQEVDSCEEPYEDSCRADEEKLSQGEPNQADSCGGLSIKSCTEKRNEETYEEEPYEEEMIEEGTCEEVPNVEEACEELEEASEEEPDEEEQVEEEPNEGESDVKESDEELDEDPEEPPDEKPCGGSPVNQFYNRKNKISAQFNSGKMNMTSDIASAPRFSELSCVMNSAGNVTVPEKLPAKEIAGKKRCDRGNVTENKVKELAENVGSIVSSSEKRKTRQSR
ncbi:uncharacterized protein A4U43_C04F8830 [Asparagus officinalis]|uniref:Uncharacterized protein n=1 Tax=Asparagus officinalis TaxID=4686 RepID=A0A5P1F004_ASPOF|nr:uncharacterized protein A4U43_C04F8830 [Asparagus officinalis]